MAIICTTCGLYQVAGTRCRITGTVRATGDTCSLTATQRLGLVKQARAVVADYRDISGRAKVTITGVSICSGGGHLTITGTVNGVSHTVTYQREELRAALDLPVRDRVLQAIVEFCALCDVASLAEAKTALEGQVFYGG